MWPISMPRAISSAEPHTGQRSPSRTSAASIVPSAVKSRPATRSNTWRPGSLAPVIQRGAVDDARVDEVADAATPYSSPSTPGPM